VVECASLENWYTCKGIESSNLSPSAILPPYVAIVLTNILTNSVRKHNDYNRLIVFGWTRKPLCPRGYRGFESHPHRQHFFRNVRKSERGFGYPRNGNAVTGEQIDEYVGALSAPA
jgi:hypothetical protein